jgi:hypothetical protein
LFRKKKVEPPTVDGMQPTQDFAHMEQYDLAMQALNSLIWLAHKKGGSVYTEAFGLVTAMLGAAVEGGGKPRGTKSSWSKDS